MHVLNMNLALSIFNGYRLGSPQKLYCFNSNRIQQSIATALWCSQSHEDSCPTLLQEMPLDKYDSIYHSETVKLFQRGFSLPGLLDWYKPEARHGLQHISVVLL